MADKDVLSAIGETSENVLHKATENMELCQTFMALVSLCALECNKRGCNMGGLQMGNVLMSGNRMIAKVTFSKLVIPGARIPEAYPNASRLVDFLHQEAHGLWLFLRKNPCLVKFLEQVSEKMDTYCKDKGKKFEEVKFAKAFMSKEDDIVIEIDTEA